MIVTLSWNQLQACRQWGSARHKQYLLGNHERTKQGHECAMPAIGWRTLADRLMHEAYHASGRRRATHLQRERSPATLTALTKVERALAQLQVHPALRNEAVEGHHGDVLVAWRIAKTWQIYPLPHIDMEVLVPVYETRQFTNFEMPITRWERRTHLDIDVPGVFLDPLDHAGWGEDALEAAQ